MSVSSWTCVLSSWVSTEKGNCGSFRKDTLQPGKKCQVGLWSVRVTVHPRQQSQFLLPLDVPIVCQSRCVAAPCGFHSHFPEARGSRRSILSLPLKSLLL